MRACGLDPASLLNPDSALPLKNVVRLLEHAATTLCVADFGLQLVDCHQDRSIIGPLTMSVLHAQTIRQALTTLAKNARFHNSGASLVMAEDKRQGFTQCRHDFGLEPDALSRHFVEQNLLLEQRILCLASNSRSEDWRVNFRHPQGMALDLYHQHFKCQVTFENPENSFVFPTSLLDIKISQSNPVLHDMAVKYLASVQRRHPLDMHSQLEEIIGMQLSSGRCTLALVAQQLGMHERALQRKLKAQAIRFDELLDGLRQQRAREYLSLSPLPLCQVAFLSGYSGQVAFTAACKRWFGATPQKFRNQFNLSSNE